MTFYVWMRLECIRQEMHIKIKETVSGNVLYFYVKNAT